MSGFMLRRDFKHIQWGATLQVMFVRALGAGIIAGIFIAFVIDSSEGSPLALTDRLQLALYASGAIIFACTFIYPWVGLISWYLLSFFVKVEGQARRFRTTDNALFFLPLAFFGLFAIGGYIGTTLLLMLGDPLAFTLHKLKPRLVPADRYGFINFVPIVFVVAPEHMAQLRAVDSAIR